MFLKSKRTGKVKARECTNGRSQKEYIGKDEASSPTVSIHVLMACCIVNSNENRHVMTFDIPGTFL